MKLLRWGRAFNLSLRSRASHSRSSWSTINLPTPPAKLRDRSRAYASSNPPVSLQAGSERITRCGWEPRFANGKWLLFTDADTVHLSGSLRRSVDEAKEFGADLLSYSPKQEVHGFWERALMPVIFAELTRTYRTVDVNDPRSRVAAANGQYLLIRRNVYDWVGGHQAIAGVLLEDVELAKRVKQSGRIIRFRYGGDAVRTRMYRSFAQMWEGWTKNLAVLFPHPVRLAILRSIEFLLIALGVLCLSAGLLSGSRVLTAAGIFLLLTMLADFLQRVLRAHFGAVNTVLSVLGLPIFAVLLVRSAVQYRWRKRVDWKGRAYPVSPPPVPSSSSSSESSLAASE